MGEVFYELAVYLMENPELKEKKNYEIYNLWSSNKKSTISNINDAKRVLDYIDDIKKIPQDLLEDCMSVPYQKRNMRGKKG